MYLSKSSYIYVCVCVHAYTLMTVFLRLSCLHFSVPSLIYFILIRALHLLLLAIVSSVSLSLSLNFITYVHAIVVLVPSRRVLRP